MTYAGSRYEQSYTRQPGELPPEPSAPEAYMWSGLAPQDPLDDKTTYFPGSELPSGWYEWNENADTDVEVDGQLQATQASSGGEHLGGAFTTTPAASKYCITAELKYVGRALVGTAGAVALFVAGDLVNNPDTAPITLMEFVFKPAAVLDLNLSSFTDYNTSTTLHATTALLKPYAKFLRIFVDNDNNTYDALVSPDGEAWVRWATVAQAATTIGAVDPTTMGISIHNVATGADAKVYSRMLRVDVTDDMFLPCGEFR